MLPQTCLHLCLPPLLLAVRLLLLLLLLLKGLLLSVSPDRLLVAQLHPLLLLLMLHLLRDCSYAGCSCIHSIQVFGGQSLPQGSHCLLHLLIRALLPLALACACILLARVSWHLLWGSGRLLPVFMGVLTLLPLCQASSA